MFSPRHVVSFKCLLIQIAEMKLTQSVNVIEVCKYVSCCSLVHVQVTAREQTVQKRAETIQLELFEDRGRKVMADFTPAYAVFCA